MSNHVETTFVGNRRISPGLTYEISYRARWVTGSRQLNTRLYFNKLARTSILEVPATSGTPGFENSTVTSNLGPEFSNLSHRPLIPTRDEDVTVAVRASDGDGVSSMSLWYSPNGDGLATCWHGASVKRRIYGRHSGDEGRQHGANFMSKPPTNGELCQPIPPAGPSSRAMYIVDDGRDRSTTQHPFRIVMTADDTAFQIENTNVLSNHRLGATIIHGWESVLRCRRTIERQRLWTERFDSGLQYSLSTQTSFFVTSTKWLPSIEKTINLEPARVIAKSY